MEQQVKSIKEIKGLFPDEWVLIGNPEMDGSYLQVLAGVPVLHSKDKREIAYRGRSETHTFNTYTVVYTGTVAPVKSAMTGIFGSRIIAK